MSIRSEAMPYRGELAYALQNLLRKNGMRAQLAYEDGKLRLLVQGHDSPLITYDVSEQQFRALCDGGTNYADKKAFNVFNSIVGKDFDLPTSYVAARNANGRVAMGLHGYRLGVGEYDYPSGAARLHAFGPDFLGWTPRHQAGFHLRRIGGVAMSPMANEHLDGRIRPGELKSGGYGYYYKQRTEAPVQTADPLKDLQAYFPPVQLRPRPAEPATPYKDLITSDVYFTNEHWQEVLSSHGIIIDTEKRTMTIQSASCMSDMQYDLTDEEVRKLTDNSLKTTSMKERLDTLNHVISDDFTDMVTFDMLNTAKHLDIHLKPEIEQSLRPQDTKHEESTQVQEGSIDSRVAHAPSTDPDRGYVNGAMLAALSDKGWYREGSHGRAVDVGDIWVEQTSPVEIRREHEIMEAAEKHALLVSAKAINELTDKYNITEENCTREKMAEAVSELDESQRKALDIAYCDAYKQKYEELRAVQQSMEPSTEETGKSYRMCAVINGEVISHEISEKMYNKYMAVDDYQRQRMMSKVFKEVDMKTRPEMREHFNLGAFLTAGLTAVSEATSIGAEISHNISHIRHPHGSPEIYAEHHGSARIYIKPGVDSPQDIASRAFDRGLNEGLYGSHRMSR